MMLAFLPDAVGMAVTELAQVLHWANAVSLDDAYKATFGVSIGDRPVHQETGKVRAQRKAYGRYKLEALPEVTGAFHRLLMSQGMSHETAHKYVLVGDYTHAWSGGQVLLAIVLRHSRTAPFRARHKHSNIVTTFNADQRAWYEAYERNVNGQAIDEVIDWAPLQCGVLRHDKVVATLLVLATEAVKFDKRSPDYWQAERRWLAGDIAAVIQESAANVQQALHALPGSRARRLVARPRAGPTASPGAVRRTERRSYRFRQGPATRGRTTPRAS
jgi:hypothetical protein